MKDQLIVCETLKGKFVVRPITWAGCWDEKGRLTYGNYLKEFSTKEVAEEYARRINKNV